MSPAHRLRKKNGEIKESLEMQNVPVVSVPFTFSFVFRGVSFAPFRPGQPLCNSKYSKNY